MTPAPGPRPGTHTPVPLPGPAPLAPALPRSLHPDPGGGTPDEGCETAPMPVLDPNPQNGQKKLLIVLGAMLAITVIIGIIASIASP